MFGAERVKGDNFKFSNDTQIMTKVYSFPHQAVLQGLLDATISSCKHIITKTEEDFSDPHITDNSVLWETDIAEYMWHESPSDIPAASLLGTRGLSTSAQGPEAGGLALKARACTPAVQRY